MTCDVSPVAMFLPFPMDYVFHLDSLNVKFAHFCIGNFKAFSGSVSRSSCPALNIWLKFGGLALPSWSLASFLNVTPDHHLSSCQVVSQYWGHEFEPSLFRVWLLCFQIICPSYWSWCSQWWNSILILIKDCEAQYWALDLNDGVFFRAMEWSMVFEKKQFWPMVSIIFFLLQGSIWPKLNM